MAAYGGFGPSEVLQRLELAELLGADSGHHEANLAARLGLEVRTLSKLPLPLLPASAILSRIRATQPR